MLQLQSSVYAVSGLACRLFIQERKAMSMQAPFFGKRPAEPITNRAIHSQAERLQTAAQSSAAETPAAPSAAPSAAVAAPVAVVAGTATPSLSGAPAKEGGSKLTVGPGIKLKGVEITDCDTLVVEGTVEATMDSRVMHITEIGAFKGSAEAQN
jgi:hypothetical protein